MQEQLAAIIDLVFSEFEETCMSVASNCQRTTEGEECIADEDSDWYDVPIDDLPVDAEILALQETPQQLGLASFQHVDRAKGSLLSESATIHGNIQFQNPEVEIHAVVNGNIDMPGSSLLLIGKRAMITGDITCNQISIAGVVIGNIYAEQVEVEQTGSIQGNVYYTTAICIASGAEVCGRIQKEDKTSKRIS